MLFSFKIKREKDATAFETKTGNHFNENDQIWYNAFYSSSQGKKKKKVVGTLPTTNHGNTSHDCNVGMDIIFMKNL